MPATFRLTRLHYWILSLLTLACLISIQASYDLVSSSFKTATQKAIFKNDQPLLPSVSALKLLSLNDEPLVADLVWLQTIQYFGGGSPYANFPALGPMVNTVSQLDPKFAYPDQFGMIVLPFMGQANTAEQLGLRAQQYIPNNGLLTYYLGTVYQLNIRDYKRAAYYYNLAATQPGTPTAAKELGAISESEIHNSQQDLNAAKIFWQNAIQDARNDYERDQATRWLAQIEIVDSLQIAAGEYKSQYGNFPTSLQELVDKKFISTIPESPIHRKLILESDGTINFDQLEDGI